MHDKTPMHLIVLLSRREHNKLAALNSMMYFYLSLEFFRELILGEKKTTKSQYTDWFITELVKRDIYHGHNSIRSKQH